MPQRALRCLSFSYKITKLWPLLHALAALTRWRGFQGGLVFCLPDRLPWISSRTQGEWLVVGPSGAQTLKNVHTWNPRRGRQGCVGHFDVWTQSGKPPHVSLSLKDIFLF